MLYNDGIPSYIYMQANVHFASGNFLFFLLSYVFDFLIDYDKMQVCIFNHSPLDKVLRVFHCDIKIWQTAMSKAPLAKTS